MINFVYDKAPEETKLSRHYRLLIHILKPVTADHWFYMNVTQPGVDLYLLI